MERKDMPVGVAMSLTINPEAMRKSATLDDDK